MFFSSFLTNAFELVFDEVFYCLRWVNRCEKKKKHAKSLNFNQIIDRLRSIVSISRCNCENFVKILIFYIVVLKLTFR